jgi:ABC-type transporter Mla subunit MlaD
MNETTLLIAFIAVTSVAVVLQTLILAGMYLSMRKMMGRMGALQLLVNDQVLPLVEKLRELVDESAPKIQAVVTNVAETSELVRSQAGKIDEAVTEIVGMARSQVGRANVLATRTLERVDLTAAVLQHSVTSPLRHLSGLLEGVLAGVGRFAGVRRERRQAKTVPNEDMFI